MRIRLFQRRLAAWLGGLVVCMGLPASCRAQAYAPLFTLPGTIRVWGDPAMASLLLTWETAFRRYHPEVSFTNTLDGTDTAMGALYLGRAELALLGRDANQTESDGFLHSLQYAPTQLRLVNGSLATSAASPAPVFLVSAANPLREITLAQAARAMGNPGAHPARIWGDLGVTGPWASHPLHVYTYSLETGTGLFLLRTLQGPGKKMNWPVVTEFTDKPHDDGSVTEAAQQTAGALLADPDGLAISTLQYASAGLKVLPVDDVTPASATLTDGSYPLTRRTYAFVNRPPGQAFPQPVSEFLRFVLSPEGQSLVTAARTPFLPLSAHDVAAQGAMLTR